MGIKPLSSLHLVQQLSNRKLVLVNKSQSWWYLEDNRHRHLQLTVLSVVGHHCHTLIRCSNFHHINHRMLDVFNCLNAIRVLRSIHPFFSNVDVEGIWINTSNQSIRFGSDCCPYMTFYTNTCKMKPFIREKKWK